MAKAVARTKRGALGIHFTVQVWKENGTYVAYAPELDVSSCGESVAEPRRACGKP